MSPELSPFVLTGNDAANAFTPEWDRLVESNPHATIFQTGQWYRAWIKIVAEAEQAEPVVLKINSRTGRLRAAIALQVSGTGQEKFICPLSSPWADYHEIAAAPGDFGAIQTLETAFDHLVREWQLPAVCDDIVSGGIMARLLTGSTLNRSPSKPVRAIDLTDAQHVERILSKKEFAIKWRRLHRAGQVSCLHHTRVDDVSARLPDFIRMHREQWADRPDAVAPFDGGTVDRAFEAMVQYLAPRKRIILTELLLNDRTIAMYFGFRYKEWYGGYRTTFDRDCFRLSPGHLMLQRMISDFPSFGIRKIDLMRGTYAYKSEYTNETRENLGFQWPGPLPAVRIKKKHGEFSDTDTMNTDEQVLIEKRRKVSV